MITSPETPANIEQPRSWAFRIFWLAQLKHPQEHSLWNTRWGFHSVLPRKPDHMHCLSLLLPSQPLTTCYLALYVVSPPNIQSHRSFCAVLERQGGAEWRWRERKKWVCWPCYLCSCLQWDGWCFLLLYHGCPGGAGLTRVLWRDFWHGHLCGNDGGIYPWFCRNPQVCDCMCMPHTRGLTQSPSVLQILLLNCWKCARWKCISTKPQPSW